LEEVYFDGVVGSNVIVKNMNDDILLLYMKNV